jgi:hypothetical protein
MNTSIASQSPTRRAVHVEKTPKKGMPIESAKEIIDDVITVDAVRRLLGVSGAHVHKRSDILWIPELALHALAGYVYVVPTVFQLRALMGSILAWDLLQVNDHMLSLGTHDMRAEYRLVLKDLPLYGAVSRSSAIEIAHMCGLTVRRMGAASALASAFLARAVLKHTLTREYVTSTLHTDARSLVQSFAVGPSEEGRILVKPVRLWEQRRELVEFVL